MYSHPQNRSAFYNVVILQLHTLSIQIYDHLSSILVYYITAKSRNANAGMMNITFILYEYFIRYISAIITKPTVMVLFHRIYITSNSHFKEFMG